ncbi:MAG: tetratricopeptide repeat protein [Gemmatimonadaceae bacterium]
MAISARIDELRKKFDENPRRYFAPLANEYRKAGDPGQAIFICETYLKEQPGHMSGHIVFGQALYDVNRIDEARNVFETALSLDPENLIALRHLGDIARQTGDNTAARNWYQRVLEADPRNDEIAQIVASLAFAPDTHTQPTDAAVTEETSTTLVMEAPVVPNLDLNSRVTPAGGIALVEHFDTGLGIPAQSSAPFSDFARPVLSPPPLAAPTLSAFDLTGRTPPEPRVSGPSARISRTDAPQPPSAPVPQQKPSLPTPDFKLNAIDHDDAPVADLAFEVDSFAITAKPIGPELVDDDGHLDGAFVDDSAFEPFSLGSPVPDFDEPKAPIHDSESNAALDEASRGEAVPVELAATEEPPPLPFIEMPVAEAITAPPEPPAVEESGDDELASFLARHTQHTGVPTPQTLGAIPAGPPASIEPAAASHTDAVDEVASPSHAEAASVEIPEKSVSHDAVSHEDASHDAGSHEARSHESGSYGSVVDEAVVSEAAVSEAVVHEAVSHDVPAPDAASPETVDAESATHIVSEHETSQHAAAVHEAPAAHHAAADASSVEEPALEEALTTPETNAEPASTDVAEAAAEHAVLPEAEPTHVEAVAEATHEPTPSHALEIGGAVAALGAVAMAMEAAAHLTPPAAAVVPPAPDWSDTPGVAPADAPTDAPAGPESVSEPAAPAESAGPPDAFVTETMAELYLQQGHLEPALEIYKQLVAQRPDDPQLRDRMGAIERGLHGVPAAPVVEETHGAPSTALPGPTIREFLSMFASRTSAHVETSNGNMPHADASAYDTVASVDASAADAALVYDATAERGSIDALFQSADGHASDVNAATVLADAFAPDDGRPVAPILEQDAPASPAHPDEAPAPAEAGREDAFSFDRFFAGDANRASRPTPRDSEPAPGDAADVAQFNQWLSGLKKPS